MRLKAIHAKNIQPIRFIEVGDLSDVVVFAGPNGVGKTRMVKWLLELFRNPNSSADQWVQIEASSPTERTLWGQNVLDTRQAADALKLRQTLQKSRRRSKYEGSVLNFESDRSITQIAPYQFTWDYQDPFNEELGWQFGFNNLSSRFQDTVHSIFRKLRSRRELIALKAEELIRLKAAASSSDLKTTPRSAVNPAENTIELNIAEFPDPLIPFKEAFSQLLAPKVLLTPEIKNQQLFYQDESGSRSLTELSSGEREVVNVVFDFMLRNPSDCIVLFDEPELHLHPELSYKLIQTLKNSGLRNQFIFCTHSADIISAALDNSVVFISPPKAESENQAVVVREDDQTHQALKLLGQSIGIVSLGRRIVLIEGEHGSLDKQTYGAILKGRFPNLVLVPSGARGQVQSFGALVERILHHTVWGVEFFMLCDRDAVPAATDRSALEITAKGRLRLLSRYHLENYFLDENIIARMFSAWEPSSSWLVSPDEIAARLKEIAGGYLSYAAALIVAGYFRERVGNAT